MKVIRYTQSWHEVDDFGTSRMKYEAGKFYPVTEESERHVARGIAEVIDAPEDYEKAVSIADGAEAKAARAVAAADDAREAANASAAALAISTQPQS